MLDSSGLGHPGWPCTALEAVPSKPSVATGRSAQSQPLDTAAGRRSTGGRIGEREAVGDEPGRGPLMAVRIVGIGGSMRADSQSERALRIALLGAEDLGAKVTMIHGSQLALPFYDPAVPERSPDAARLIEEVRA